jgi:hypothetical protein
MTIPPKHLKSVSEAIGDAFSPEEIVEILRRATGQDLYKAYASPNDPLHLAVQRVLEKLIEEGSERWFLIYVLVTAVTNEQLRWVIVKVSPDTLATLPSVDGQVDGALQSLMGVKTAVLKPEYIRDLKESLAKISDITEQIRTLSACKNLHECLHTLHLKLAFRSAAAGDLERVKNVEETGAVARAASAQLSADAGVELEWIAELERLAGELKTAIEAANFAAMETGFDRAQRLIRLQLSHLNAKIFDAADKLSLDGLLFVLPAAFRHLEDALFTPLDHAIRDLKATVMARALVHKIWQDAENELSFIEDLLSLPATDVHHFIAQHWLLLRSRVLLLAALDPEAQWAKDTQVCSDRMEVELTRETLSDTMKPSFEAFCRVLRFHFFEVDARLKDDCGSLGKFYAPLGSMIEEIRSA